MQEIKQLVGETKATTGINPYRTELKSQMMTCSFLVNLLRGNEALSEQGSINQQSIQYSPAALT